MRGPGGRPLRVAHLTTVDEGLARLSTELAVDLEAGFDTFGISAPGPDVARVESLGVTHVAVGFTTSGDVAGDLGSAIELARVLRRLRPDVLHTHTSRAGVVGRLVGRSVRVPVVVNTCHGFTAPARRHLPRALVIAAEGIAARWSHHDLFQNAADRETLRWAVPDGRATIVGSGVDLERFRFDAAGRTRIRAEWGIGPDEVLVGGVGRRVAEKGIAELGAAARALERKARTVWVGPDDDGTDALRAAGAGIDFVGPQADMPAVYSAFDVFALPSHGEGFARTAVEAAACSRPSVVTDVRGGRELGVDGEHVLLVPPRDPKALTAALGRLVRDGELRHRLGAAAGARARAAFDERQVAALSIATYRAVAERRGLRWEV